MNGDGQLSLAEILERTEAIKQEQEVEAPKQNGEPPDIASSILIPRDTLPYPHPHPHPNKSLSLVFLSHPHSVPNPHTRPPLLLTLASSLTLTLTKGTSPAEVSVEIPEKV